MTDIEQEIFDLILKNLREELSHSQLDSAMKYAELFARYVNALRDSRTPL